MIKFFTYSYDTQDMAALGTVCAIRAPAPLPNPFNPSFLNKHLAVLIMFAYLTFTYSALLVI